eukprot:2720788-Alexandrium_andersonii.AAC.1
MQTSIRTGSHKRYPTPKEERITAMSAGLRKAVNRLASLAGEARQRQAALLGNYELPAWDGPRCFDCSFGSAQVREVRQARIILGVHHTWRA